MTRARRRPRVSVAALIGAPMALLALTACDLLPASPPTGRVSASAPAGTPTEPPKAVPAVPGTRPSVRISSTASNPSAAPGTNVTFTLDVTNSGDTPLVDTAVSAPDCTDQAGPFKLGGNDDSTLDRTETWRYACSRVMTDDAALNFAARARDPERLVPVTAQSRTVVYLPRPGISLVATPDRTRVAAGTPVQFSFDLTSGDDAPLTDVVLSAPGCVPVSKPTKLGGDADDVLEQGETWRSTCTVPIAADTTELATASAVDARRPEPVTDGAGTTVKVVRPSVGLAETTRTPSVTAGQSADLDFEVTADGDTALADVELASESCTDITAVAGGDTDGDNLLDPGETWDYSCRAPLAATTVDVSAVTVQDVSTGSVVTRSSSVAVSVDDPAPAEAAPVPRRAPVAVNPVPRSNTVEAVPAQPNVALAEPNVPLARPNVPLSVPQAVQPFPDADQFPGEDLSSKSDSSASDSSKDPFPDVTADSSTLDSTVFDTSTEDPFADSFTEFDSFTEDTFTEDTFTEDTFTDTSGLPTTGFTGGRLVAPGLLLTGSGLVLAVAGRRRRRS